MRFQDKVVVVTGAAQGIGEAYARALAAEGASVVVADPNAEAGSRWPRTSGALRAHRRVVARVRGGPGGGHHRRVRRDRRLVNNAAIYGDMQFDLLISVDWDYYRRFMSVNMDGVLVMTRAGTLLQQRGGGSIVNQSSTAAYLYSGFYGPPRSGSTV